MNSREKALAELRRRIREQKARIDPRLLKLAARAALPGTAGGAGEAVPYDRDAAARAIDLFLGNHRDRKGFEQRLAEFIVKNRH